MCEHPLVLVYDLGTQSVRVMLINKQGSIEEKVQHKFEHPYYSINPGWAEQKAYVYWDAICSITKQLKERTEDKWNRIVAATVTTIRDTCVCVDKDGNVLRDIILWLDKREAQCKNPLPAANRMMFKAVNMDYSVKIQRKASACNWIMENEPDIWKKTHKFIMLSCYLNFLFTGMFKDSWSNQVGHLPFNYRDKKWMGKMDIKRCIFDVEPEKLCDLIPPGEVVGKITQNAALETGLPEGLPLIASGSDKGCETLGLSCCTSDKASLSFGTTATVQLSSDRYFEPQPFAPSYPAVLRDKYNPEIEIYRGYWLVSWFKREFAHHEVIQAKEMNISPEELLNKRLKEIPPGCHGLILQPYFTPGLMNPYAKGSIIGFSDVHTRIHIYRAIIEGINFSLIDGMKTMERRGGIKVKSIYVAGGGSQSDEICQITADMFGLPVFRIQTHEAAGLGAAIVGFVWAGVYKDYDEAVKGMVHIKDEFLPDKENHGIYSELYSQIFCNIYNKLEPLYKKTKAILHKH